MSVQTVASLPQPEPEAAPLVSPRFPEREAASSSEIRQNTEFMENAGLTQALRRSAEALDGIHSSRQRPEADSDAFLANKTERKYKKKTQKQGAGMELHFAKESEEIQKELIETMKKEWSNWEKYSDDPMDHQGPAQQDEGGEPRNSSHSNEVGSHKQG